MDLETPPTPPRAIPDRPPRSRRNGFRPSPLARWVPILGWLPGYRRGDLEGDVVAGVIVAIMLVPQGMAYALLAGLPPEIGLYASIAPVLVYGVLGTSRALAVGPVAIASLMAASVLNQVAAPGSPEFLAGALVLAFLSGAILLAMGFARLGFLVNFLSHPVISGFTSAAAIVIVFSQIKHLLGLEVPRGLRADEIIAHVAGHIGEASAATAAFGIGGILLLLAVSRGGKAALGRLRVPPAVAGPLTRSGPLLVVLLATFLVWLLGLGDDGRVAIVGAVPAGLPPLTLPSVEPEFIRPLLSGAILLSLIGYLESISVAKALASKRRQRIDPNQELVALGAANLSAAFTGAYPVAGGFGRSSVNFGAGANTPLASMITAALIALTLVLFTPVFYHLPNAVLAAIIIVAVSTLVDVDSLRQAWRYNKADAASLLITFAAVLAFGVEAGMLAGVGVSLVLYLWRTSRPHIAIVGRVGETEHFRNILRHSVRTCPHVLAVRVDESLYFANTQYLEDRLLATVAENPEYEHLVLICSAVNFIDTSALESLEDLIVRLRDAGVTLHLAEVKGPVMDKLETVQFLNQLGSGRVFLSTHEAMTALGCP